MLCRLESDTEFIRQPSRKNFFNGGFFSPVSGRFPIVFPQFPTIRSDSRWAVRLHEPANAFLARRIATITQLAPDPWRAIGTLGFQVHGADQHQQCHAGQLRPTGATGLPFGIATAAIATNRAIARPRSL